MFVVDRYPIKPRDTDCHVYEAQVFLRVHWTNPERTKFWYWQHDDQVRPRGGFIRPEYFTYTQLPGKPTEADEIALFAKAMIQHPY